LLAALAAMPVNAQQHSKYANKLAPYVASPIRLVDRMLELANIKPGETVYDLGSGDGRIVISAARKFGAIRFRCSESDRAFFGHSLRLSAPSPARPARTPSSF